VAERIEARLSGHGGLPIVGRAEIVRSVFYRGQSAYVVGLLYAGSVRLPMVLSLRHEKGGVVVDAVLLTEDEVSILFSFTRSHFHVAVPRPYDLVRFLGRLMPRKRIAELYIAIGQNKHGKTELYRDLLRHVNATDERFDHVPGTKGLVMIVFGMPGYDDVFKVIRDRFPPPKRTTRKSIMEKYRLVSSHDRAGRLIDAQNFQHLEFERSRFGPDLLDELVSEAGRTVQIEDDTVVISHLYVERRVIPLDLFAREAVAPAAEAAVLDYGQAIKDLACTNIFPGDLLTKNFGVTRHGRVVFYDYDELSNLTDVVFREIPEPRDDIEALAEDPWFPVGDRDVFPEEHERFLGLSPRLRQALQERHGDLFEVEAWRAIQHRIDSGELIEIFPYGDEARLAATEDLRGW
jgi:isocitrate dehydrogenase kinase/phosphatase